MNRLEQRNCVYETLCRYNSEKSGVFVEISTIKNNADRLDRYNKEIRELSVWTEYFGSTYGKDYVYWIFNGCYYERIQYDVIESGLERWLDSMGLSAIDRNRRSMYTYMYSVLGVIRDRVLKPDLSVMCFQNGVVDMSELVLHPFSPKFDVIKQYGFKFDRMEIYNCPLWLTFLGEIESPGGDIVGILPEKGKRRLLQMFLGASLMNRRNISFEYFMILQGTGANGKSVIYRVLKDMFGDDEILNIRLSQFAKGGDEGLRAAFSMDGKRLMFCTESTRNDFTDTSTIKAISSGEPIACREIGGNITMMQRPPVLICNSNYRWRLSDFLNRDDPEDTSMQRRAVLINFDKTIPVDKRDTLLAQRMKDEHAGIFAWIVKGLYGLRRNGYRMPESPAAKIEQRLGRIRSAVRTESGKKIEGSVSEYLLYKKCLPMPADNAVTLKMAASELYRNYDRFCNRAGVLPVSQKKFSLDMLSLGYERRQTLDKNNASTYILYCTNNEMAEKFLLNVPSIASDAEEEAFDGEEYTDDDFINDMDVREMEGYGERNDIGYDVL